MKAKILMLAGIMASVIFLSSSAFAGLVIRPEKTAEGNYVKIVITAENPTSTEYPEVGIQYIKEVEEELSASDHMVKTTKIETYSDKGIPTLMIDKREIYDAENKLLHSDYTKTEISEYDAEKRVTKGKREHFIYTPEGNEELIEIVDFENTYNSQGQKTDSKEHEYVPAHENEGVSIHRTYLEDKRAPVQPFYVLYAVPGNSSVQLGCIFVEKPMEGETAPVHVYDISVTDGAGKVLGTLENYKVDPNGD